MTIINNDVTIKSFKIKIFEEFDEFHHYVQHGKSQSGDSVSLKTALQSTQIPVQMDFAKDYK